MSEPDVRIVKLDDMRVGSAYGFGKEPEGQAWDTLLSWAREQGLLEDLSFRRFYGFNNPDPSPGSPEYGYEQWMTVGSEVEGSADVKIKEVPGATYAVLRCERLSTIGARWRQLVNWVEDSPYQWGRQECLEALINPQVFIPEKEGVPVPDSIYEQLIFDLFIPIVE